MSDSNKVSFAPQLHIKSGVREIDFYSRAFGATELRRWINEDGTIHVAELSIDGAIFYLHEEKPEAESVSPDKHMLLPVPLHYLLPMWMLLWKTLLWPEH